MCERKFHWFLQKIKFYILLNQNVDSILFSCFGTYMYQAITHIHAMMMGITLISWICWSSPPMSAYVSWGAFSSFITVTIGSVSSPKTPTTACTYYQWSEFRKSNINKCHCKLLLVYIFSLLFVIVVEDNKPEIYWSKTRFTDVIVFYFLNFPSVFLFFNSWQENLKKYGWYSTL